jgi:hypothetical protein
MKNPVLGVVVAAGMIVMATTVFGQTNLTVVRHNDNTLWKMTCDGTSNCSSWAQISGKFSVQPTLTWDPVINKYILMGIGNNQTSIWRSTFDADGTFNNNWTQITGVSPSPVAVAGGAFKGFSRRVAIVAPEGGNYTSPVDAMNDLSSWCGTASQTNTCLLKIMPGTYNVGTSSVQMQPFVDIEGSGEYVTKITGSKSSIGYCDAEVAVVYGATAAEIRFLAVENVNASGTYAVAILNNFQSSPKITNVRVSSQSPNTAYNYAIVNCPGSPEMLNVNVFGGDGLGINRAIYNSFGSNVQMTNVVARARGGIYADGIRNEDSGVWLRNCVAWGEYASIGSYGLANTATSSAPWITVENSRIAGGTRAIINGLYNGASVAYSEIDGGVDNLGYLKCIGAYTHNLDPLSNTCQ